MRNLRHIALARLQRRAATDLPTEVAIGDVIRSHNFLDALKHEHRPTGAQATSRSVAALISLGATS